MIKLEESIQMKSKHFNEEKKENYGTPETAVITVKQTSKNFSSFCDLILA